MADNGAFKVTLYWLEKSRAQRIVWLLEELNIPYSIKTFKRRADMTAPDELKKIHPLGKSPIISIEAPHLSKPLVLAESAVIIEYLCTHFGGERFLPQRYSEGKEGQVGGETEEWMRYQYFMHYTEGSLTPFLVMKVVMDSIRNAPVPFFIKPVTKMVASKVEGAFVNPNIHTNLSFLEDQLKTAPGGGPYICGETVTAADIVLSYSVIAALSRLGSLRNEYPTVAAYADRLQALDGYKRGVAQIEKIEGSFKASL
ncbi:glutathione S-transferase [Aspergillus clavatus NRRL 1]|uniref:glutathione transferase n=1 Tax=Aspergillus clavatus (strain ATCC 1007 / CBS 513.65 / DSM 816 / NCTC 3887 / NRRL 1 / QM 1276 / 107) TaxID=344612 RepID=A1C8H2_ASPCL|nr:glutathione S-transferase [Aspergillus clavatus NRRL 1]EAW13609.1 glutathione S-transferase [Aspergillus clavatus NRRL 1]